MTLPAFECFPVEPVAWQGEPIRNARGQACMTAARVWYVDGWAQARSNGTRIHRAVDIGAPQGSLVRSPWRAKVIKSTADTGPTGRGGHALTIKHESGYTLYFAHLRDAPLVRRGDRVEPGQLLGYVGRTGNAETTCPHLHIAAENPQREKVNLFSELVRTDPRRGRRTSARSDAPKTKGHEARHAEDGQPLPSESSSHTCAFDCSEDDDE